MRSSSVKKTRSSRQLELPVKAQPSDVDSDAAERAAAIVESLPTLSGEEVFAAFEQLDDLPSAVVRDALVPSTGPAPDPERLDDSTRRAHGFAPRPLRLRTIAVVKDADIFDLGTTVEEQVRLAGKAWDGADLPAEERLDGEAEGTFAGTLEHHVLVDAEAAGIVPMYDVLLHADDAGSIFRAGTSELVGAIAYGTVEMKDRRARLAIQQALAVPFDGAAFEPEQVVLETMVDDDAPTLVRNPRPKPPVATDTAKELPTAKRGAAPKKAAASKKAAAEKVASKPASKKAAAEKAAKPASKKAAAEKPASKKTASKKAATSKPASKKAATSKPASKKVAAAPKKAATKKAPASKATATKATATKKSAPKRSR